jgi:phosphoenolpyruvate carboxylase
MSLAKNVVRPRSVGQSRRLSVRVAAAVKFDYDTKVFKKELVKFADTEEYIYRWVHNVARVFCFFLALSQSREKSRIIWHGGGVFEGMCIV